MSPEGANIHEPDVFKWAVREKANNFSYWQDRQKNGNGLIQQIADFVIERARYG